MGRQVVSVVFVVVSVVVMVLVIVGVDVLLFRHHGWERLAVNVGVVLVFVACYARFVPHR